VHKTFDVKLDNHTLVYIVFKIKMENKQYGTNFEVAISLNKLNNSKTFFMPFVFNF
jgi:hypothetical protein